MLLIMIGFVFLTGAVRVCQATEFDQDHDHDQDKNTNATRRYFSSPAPEFTCSSRLSTSRFS